MLLLFTLHTPRLVCFDIFIVTQPDPTSHSLLFSFPSSDNKTVTEEGETQPSLNQSPSSQLFSMDARLLFSKVLKLVVHLTFFELTNSNSHFQETPAVIVLFLSVCMIGKVIGSYLTSTYNHLPTLYHRHFAHNPRACNVKKWQIQDVTLNSREKYSKLTQTASQILSTIDKMLKECQQKPCAM